MTILTETRELIIQQLQSWTLASNNYLGLQKVKTKSVELDGGSKIKVQFNPERIRSSAARVDAKSIEERPCFLCDTNRPEEQKGVDYGDYTILVNPFPIFNEHLTIPHKEHTLQLIAPYFRAMLNLARDLHEFTMFYNGPKCGASAPDHFHFQAGIKDFMPLETDFRGGQYSQLVNTYNGVELYNWAGYHRGVITLKGRRADTIEELFNKLHKILASRQADEVEPMLNVLTYFENEYYIVHVFPRILHRPDCYFATGNKQILISPASVDMGGVFITPCPEDFEKITAPDIANILQQVCLDENTCLQLIKQLPGLSH